MSASQEKDCVGSGCPMVTFGQCGCGNDPKSCPVLMAMRGGPTPSQIAKSELFKPAIIIS